MGGNAVWERSSGWARTKCLGTQEETSWILAGRKKRFVLGLQEELRAVRSSPQPSTALPSALHPPAPACPLQADSSKQARESQTRTLPPPGCP